MINGNESSMIYKFGDCELDADLHELRVEGKTFADLTAQLIVDPRRAGATLALLTMSDAGANELTASL